MCSARNVVQALRAATGDAHQALDRAIDPVAALREFPRRIAMLRRYHVMHAGAEAAMAPFLAADHGLCFDRRRRAAVLLADLAALGASPARTVAVPTITTHPAALGMLYVMEGSTLGGKLIRRDLQADGVDMTGLGFLDPYGADAGRMWRVVIDRLESSPAADLQAVVDGAVAGFGYAAACLAAPVPSPALTSADQAA